MIKSSKEKTTIVGRKTSKVVDDLSLIFEKLLQIIGDDKKEKILTISYEVIKK